MAKKRIPPFATLIHSHAKSIIAPADERTSEERYEHGRQLREEVPHESHATWTPAPDRDDPVELLKSQGVTRVQELLPLRYERMSVSAFTFYWGGALIIQVLLRRWRKTTAWPSKPLMVIYALTWPTRSRTTTWQLSPAWA